MKSINFPWNPPLLARHPFPLLLLTSLLATRVKTEKFTISKKQGSYFGNRILFILVHIYLDFLKTSYASNYFWDSEYFWDIFIRYFLNFFYGPPLPTEIALKPLLTETHKRRTRKFFWPLPFESAWLYCSRTTALRNPPPYWPILF